MDIESILDSPTSGWFRKAPADPMLIEKLCAECPFEIPPVLLELWRFSDGGESEHLSLPPGIFVQLTMSWCGIFVLNGLSN